MAENVKFNVTYTRVKDLTVDEFIALQEGNMRIIKNVLSRFVVDENGQYLPEDQAKPLVGKLTLEQLQGVVSTFTGNVTDTLVPPVNSGLSG